jgi:RNA polymerase sigma-70 factor (ECF subfamily)
VTLEDGDDDLLARAGRGDREAFAALVARHERRLMALALRLTPGRAAAEDAVQEAFTRAWVQAPRWRPSSAGRPGVGAWLARVVTNIAIDSARRAPTAALDDVLEPADPSVPADEGLIQSERQARLRAAIRALPARQRVALGLAYDGGLSNSEGAGVMQVSVGAFELLLVRARRTLRAALVDEEIG